MITDFWVRDDSDIIHMDALDHAPGFWRFSVSMGYACRYTGNFTIAGISTRVDQSYTTGRYMRPGGTIGSPTVAAGFLSMLLATALSVLLSSVSRSFKLLAAVLRTGNRRLGIVLYPRQ